MAAEVGDSRRRTSRSRARRAPSRAGGTTRSRTTAGRRWCSSSTRATTRRSARGSSTPTRAIIEQFAERRRPGARHQPAGLSRATSEFSCKHGGFAFPLLADTDKEVGEAYGILGPLGFYRRSVFVVDGEGIVRYAHRAGRRAHLPLDRGDRRRRCRAPRLTPTAVRGSASGTRGWALHSNLCSSSASIRACRAAATGSSSGSPTGLRARRSRRAPHRTRRRRCPHRLAELKPTCAPCSRAPARRGGRRAGVLPGQRPHRHLGGPGRRDWPWPRRRAGCEVVEYTPEPGQAGGRRLRSGHQGAGAAHGADPPAASISRCGRPTRPTRSPLALCHLAHAPMRSRLAAAQEMTR